MTTPRVRAIAQPLVVRGNGLVGNTALASVVALAMALLAREDRVVSSGLREVVPCVIAALAMGAAFSLAKAALSTRLVVHDHSIEYLNELTGRLRGMRRPSDIARYYVYLGTLGSGRTYSERWRLRLECRTGGFHDLRYGTRNLTALAAYLDARGIPRVDGPPPGARGLDPAVLASPERARSRVLRNSTVRALAAFAIAIAVGWGAIITQDIVEAVQSRRWPATVGHMTSVDIRQYGSSESAEYEPIVRYAYMVNGLRWEGTRLSLGGDRTYSLARAKGVAAVYAPGEEVEVYFDPQAPARAALILRPDPMRWRDAALCALIFCIGLAGLLRRRRPTDEPPF